MHALGYLEIFIYLSSVKTFPIVRAWKSQDFYLPLRKNSEK
jgi:hypothetical protein